MNKQLINFTDEEIFAEAERREDKNLLIDALKNLSWAIKNGVINNKETPTLTYAQDGYVYSLNLKTGQLERRKE